MTTSTDPSDLGTDHNTIRDANRRTVATYMGCRGQDRLQRNLLFTEDGTGGLWTTETGEPIVISGRDRLGEHAVWSLQCFPDWVWINVEIFDTQDPNRFWVECDGEGAIVFPGYERGHYTNHFIHSFEFENGLIKRQREFMNPCRQFQALGMSVPVIRREGIPT